jgi:hypothetical protein
MRKEKAVANPNQLVLTSHEALLTDMSRRTGPTRLPADRSLGTTSGTTGTADGGTSRRNSVGMANAAQSAQEWRAKDVVSVPFAGMQVLGLSRQGSYDAANRGEIPTIRVGRRLLVPVIRLRRLLGESV